MLIFCIIVILLSNALNVRRDLSILFNRVAIISLVYCAYVSYISNLNSNEIGLHSGLLLYNNINILFHTFIYVIVILVLTLTGFYSGKINIKNSFATTYFGKKSEQYLIAEYPLIILFVVTGAVLLVSTNDFVSIFLAIELQSYGLYILSTIHRNSELSTTGGLIYFLLGGLSSCFILLGTALFYSNTGSTSLDNIYIITNITDLTLNNL
jgi:NADH-ubiquinone oxidoreductase chain 2